MKSKRTKSSKSIANIVDSAVNSAEDSSTNEEVIEVKTVSDETSVSPKEPLTIEEVPPLLEEKKTPAAEAKQSDQPKKAPDNKKSDAAPAKAKAENEAVGIKKEASKPAEPATKKKGSGGAMIAIIIAVVAVILSAGSVFLTYQKSSGEDQKEAQSEKNTEAVDNLLGEIKQLKTAVSSNQAGGESSVKSLKASIAQQQQVIEGMPPQIKKLVTSELQAIITALEQQKLALSNQDSRIAQLESRLEVSQALLSNLPSQKTLWQLIEVLQLHRSALMHAQVNRDASAARLALEMSLKVLRPLAVDDKELVVKNTTDVLNKLRFESISDPEATNKVISRLGRQLLKLPLDTADSSISMIVGLDKGKVKANGKAKKAEAHSEEPWYRLLWTDVMSELDKVVRYVPESRPFMPPDGEYFIRENMALSILTLRSAMLRQDEVTYQAELEQLGHWVVRYGKDGRERRALINTLKKLETPNAALPLSDLKQLVIDTELMLSRQSPQNRRGQ